MNEQDPTNTASEFEAIESEELAKKISGDRIVVARSAAVAVAAAAAARSSSFEDGRALFFRASML